MVGFTRAVGAALLEHGAGAAAALAICEACVRFVPVSGAGVTLMSSVDAQVPLCATDEVATRIDALQFALGEGPCVDAFRAGEPVMVADITDRGGRSRWPVFATEVAPTGARGLYAIPLRVGAQTLGVLDCYRTSPGELGPSELSATLRASDGLVIALLNSGIEEALMGRLANTTESFDYSVLLRSEVHQATGMITEQAGVDVAQALARLRAAAFATGRPIEDLALDVLARRYRFEPDQHGNGRGERE
jgi:GAF domain-containing protein